MAGLFGMPRPRGKRQPDNLLGLTGDIGMTDSSFQGMGRAPVDELWAGRYSAAIDDELFDDAVATANETRQMALDLKDKEYLNGQPEFNKTNAEQQWEIDARRAITNTSGLDLYPGHLNSNVKNPTYMVEFSDKGSEFRGGAFDLMAEKGKKGDAVYLGQVFDHPELYRHYPEAQMLPVAYTDLGEDYLGAYTQPEGFDGTDFEGKVPQGLIQLNSSIEDQEEQRETLLHELQHYIQKVEGWQNGGMSSTELGMQYGDHLENNADPTSPQSQQIAKHPQTVRERSGEIMPFMQREAMGIELARPAYQALTGEQLARDATYRDKHDLQGEYYLGNHDGGGEFTNWYPSSPTHEPMAGALKARAALEDAGILGVLSPTGKLSEEVSDPYIEKYRSLLGI